MQCERHVGKRKGERERVCGGREGTPLGEGGTSQANT